MFEQTFKNIGDILNMGVSGSKRSDVGLTTVAFWLLLVWLSLKKLTEILKD